MKNGSIQFLHFEMSRHPFLAFEKRRFDIMFPQRYNVYPNLERNNPKKRTHSSGFLSFKFPNCLGQHNETVQNRSPRMFNQGLFILFCINDAIDTMLLEITQKSNMKSNLF